MTLREQQFISATLWETNPKVTRAIVADMPASAFSCDGGREAWEQITEMVELGTLCPIELINRLGNEKAQPLMRGATVRREVFESWLVEIKTEAYGRYLRQACYAVAADEGTADPAKLHADLKDALTRYRADYSTTPIDGMAETVEKFEAFATEMQRRKASGKSLPFGIPEIDQRAILIPSYLLVLARTSHGKTAMMCNMALGQAAAGYCPVIITGEQPARQIVGRLLSLMMTCPLAVALGLGRDTEAVREAREGAKAWLRASGITILDGRRSVANIAASAGRLSLQGRCDCLYIDQMSRIDHQQRHRETKEQAWTRTSNTLATLWQDIEAPVILLAQLNSKDAKDHPSPHQSHIKDCGSLLDDSDSQLLIDRPEEDFRRFEAMEKQRIKHVAAGDLQDADSVDARDRIWITCTKDRTSLMGGKWLERIEWDKRCGGIGGEQTEEV